MKKVDYVCAACGKNGVLRDAYSVWNPDTQKEELYNTYDNFFCPTCDKECSVMEVDYVPPKNKVKK